MTSGPSQNPGRENPGDWARPPGYKTPGYKTPGYKTPRRRRRWPWIVVGAVIAVIAVGLIAPDNTRTSSDQAAAVRGSTSPGPTTSTVSPTPSSSQTPVAAPTRSTVVESSSDAQASLDLLATLAVKGRAPQTGYSRAQFGQAWSDDVNVADGHNGCDTRNDILRRDLTNVVARDGTRGCVITAGVLADPYTNSRIDFVRGEKTSQAVQIDHVVALDDAWQKGAQQLDADTRRDFANDPRNLQATDGPTNGRKGSGDAATWLPPSTAYRCTYVSKQVTVKAAYRLWVTAAERDAIAGVLTRCGATARTPSPNTTAPPPVTSRDTPRPAAPVAPRYTPPPAAPPAPPAPVVPAPAPPDDSSVSYANCAAVRAAGKAPIRVGEPGYSTALDRDRDGVGCE